MIRSIYSKDSDLWDVIDLDTGKRIPRVQYANDETGQYKILELDENSIVKTCICPECGDCHSIIKNKYGNIKLVRKSKEGV